MSSDAIAIDAIPSLDMTTTTSSDRRAQALLPLTEATYWTLASLATPRHGYAIMQTVAAASGGEVRLGPGTLYAILAKLLQQKLIRRAGESVSEGERRKEYMLTSLGRQVVELECERLERLARAGRQILQGEVGT
jgi:DNA-binding PadR family transcriptional regulator